MATKLANDQIRENEAVTLAAAVADTSLLAGDTVVISDRAYGVFDVVLSSSVTDNTYNIVQCTGVANLALVLRAEAHSFAAACGVTFDGSTDDGDALQHVFDNSDILDNSSDGLSELQLPTGTCIVNAPITIPSLTFKLTAPGMGRTQIKAGASFPTTGHRGVIEIPADGQFIEIDGLNIDCASRAQYGILTPITGAPSDDRKHVVIKNTQVVKATEVCFAIASWMLTMEQCRGGGNNTSTVIFDIGKITIDGTTSSREGTTTSLTNCYALQPQDYGFRFTSIAGLVLNACSADNLEHANKPYAYRFENCTATMTGCECESVARYIESVGSDTAQHITANTCRFTGGGKVASTAQLIQLSGGSLNFRNTFIDDSSVGGNVTYAVSAGAGGRRVTFDSSSSNLSASTNSLTTNDQLTEVSPVTKARVTMSGTDQTGVATATETQVEFDVEDYDIGSNFDTTAAAWDFTVPGNGFYRISGQLTFVDIANNAFVQARIKTGSTILCKPYAQASNGGTEMTTVQFDYTGHFSKAEVITVHGYHTHGSNRDIEGDKDATYLHIEKVM
jgi:hypothetical protein